MGNYDNIQNPGKSVDNKVKEDAVSPPGKRKRFDIWAGYFVALVCSALIPYLIHSNTLGAEALRTKQETLKSFSRYITIALSYQKALSLKDCQLSDVANKENSNRLATERDELYKKYIEIPEPYESLCALAKANFGDVLSSDVDSFMKLYESFMDIEYYQKNNDGFCTPRIQAREAEKILLVKYDDIIDKMAQQIKKGR